MARRSKHIVLVPNTVATVELDGAYDFIEVMNVSGGSAPIYFDYGGTRDVPADPSVMGDGTVILLPAQNSVEVQVPPDSGRVIVKLISAGTPQVSVRGY